MIDHPGLVRDIHADYFAAGATVATTNTYAIHHDRLAGFGLDPWFHALHLRALAEVHEARAANGGRGRIAGSFGPLVASYRPDLTPPIPEAAAKYAEIACLFSAHVDLILIETMSSLDLAEGAVIGAQRPESLSGFPSRSMITTAASCARVSRLPACRASFRRTAWMPFLPIAPSRDRCRQRCSS